MNFSNGFGLINLIQPLHKICTKVSHRSQSFLNLASIFSPISVKLQTNLGGPDRVGIVQNGR